MTVPMSPLTVGREDPRYIELSHSDNHRFAVEPAEFVLPVTSDDVVASLQKAVSEGHGVACRSGGHCGQDFVGAPRRDLVLDLHNLNSIGLSEDGLGVRVGAGATVDQTQKALFRRWNAALPLGACSAVGMGGLVAGGGYGPLSRQLGLVVDHLHAVEVAVVDESRNVRLVTARADASGDLGELFWAHTGGGGGNFGIVTAYEFRSPEHLAAEPIGLPRACSRLHVQKVMYPWAAMDEESFVTVMRRFFEWHERHCAPGAPEASLFATFFVHHRSSGFLQLMVQQDADVDPEGEILKEFVASLTEGTGAVGIPRGGVMSWLTGTRYMSQADCGDVMGARSASKSAYHRAAPTDDQFSVLHRHLNSDHPGQASYVMFNSYGGEINRRAPSATVAPQRDSVVKSSWFSAWQEAELDELHINWLRGLYEEFFADTGGVPVTGDRTDGCYINYPDIDLLDPVRNRSEQPWHHLYYKENYSRLRSAKRTWDPLNIFHHSMSIEL
ncbi:FAD-binding protein [Streptomyces atratus]|uniref:FAD-binding protein n=1 Tax=Streptomyces atratus TaxID=1893 RepID=UPI002254DD68|nr:FAD-binding protein [Streptomyces atratus]MCX5339785.1 FAD-binding protein [Streptomyces atratus]